MSESGAVFRNPGPLSAISASIHSLDDPIFRESLHRASLTRGAVNAANTKRGHRGAPVSVCDSIGD